MPKVLALITMLCCLLSFPSSTAQSPAFINPVDLLQGKKKITVPFRYTHNFILLDTKIFGVIPVNLIFDTGAEHIILFDREYTDFLKVPYDKRIPIMGSDLSRQIYALIARNSVIELRNLPARKVDMLILEEDYFNLDAMLGTEVNGLIGGGFFKNMVLNIDYRKQELHLINPQHFEPPKDYMAVPIRIKTNKPYLNAEANLGDGTVVQVDLLVDTGAGVPLLLHNNSHASLHLPDDIITGKLGMGLGGFLEGYVGRIGNLKLGDLEFPNMLTSFQDIEAEWLKDEDRFRNGIVGNQLLSRFNVFIDYFNGYLYLKPYKQRQLQFSMDRSGLLVLAYGPDFTQFLIKDVREESPGGEAGLQKNDIILKLQGVPAHLYTLDNLNAILQKKPGKKIRMIVQRGDEILRKTFILRELI